MKESSPEVTASSATTRQSTSRVPVDLIVVGGFGLLAAVVLVGWNPSSPVVRATVGIPLVFLAPGYALVSLLYPRATTLDEHAETDSERDRARSISDGERAALSFGLSFALLPFFGLLIPTVAAFTQEVVVTALSGFVVVVAILATVRRLRVPPTERYRVGLASRAVAFRSWLFQPESPIQTAVNAFLLVSVVLALSTGGYALLAPQDGEQYTNLHLLTEADDGEYVAAGYPEEIEPGEEISLTVAVENQEGEYVEYTLIVQQQRVEGADVVERESLDQVDYLLNDGETGYGDRTVTPTVDAGEIRIAFLLYEAGDVPETPTIENAYRSTYLWMDVQPVAD